MSEFLVTAYGGVFSYCICRSFQLLHMAEFLVTVYGGVFIVTVYGGVFSHCIYGGVSCLFFYLKFLEL